MSDDFDKEAEREKLREQFEREEQRREATQQMSELLLQGATMTNKHCDTCGDPVFRHEGHEFCANCQSPDGDAAAAGGADAQNAPQNAGERAQQGGRQERPSDADGGASEVPVEPEPRTTESRSEARADRTPTRETGDRGSGAADPTPTGQRTPQSGGAANGEGAAAALQRSLEKFSRLAAETDDPREAKRHLEAAREAAEALSALRR
jgi:uncharacterized Zn finger protein (UPF0148 family)